MHNEVEMMVAYLYVEDRHVAADRERLVREALRYRRERSAFMVWIGRGLVRIGQRLEAFGRAGAWEQAKAA